jgi:hypothetical protein
MVQGRSVLQLSIASFRSHRCCYRHSPLFRSGSEHVAQYAPPFLGTARLSEILQLNCDSHHTAIQPNIECTSAVQTRQIHNRQACAPDLEQVYSQFMLKSGTKRSVDVRETGKAATLVMLQPSAPAREPTAWMHAPSQPLMRSLLSQFQTPTVPRRIRRFFRVWLLFRLPFRADHSAYFGSTSFTSPILSAVDASKTKQLLH